MRPTACTRSWHISGKGAAGGEAAIGSCQAGQSERADCCVDLASGACAAILGAHPVVREERQQRPQVGVTLFVPSRRAPMQLAPLLEQQGVVRDLLKGHVLERVLATRRRLDGAQNVRRL